MKACAREVEVEEVAEATGRKREVSDVTVCDVSRDWLADSESGTSAEGEAPERGRDGVRVREIEWRCDELSPGAGLGSEPEPECERRIGRNRTVIERQRSRVRREIRWRSESPMSNG